MGEQLPYKQWVTGSSPVAPTRTVRKNNMREWLSGRASPCQGECRGFESRLPLQKFFRTVFLWRYSQVVRPGSAKPSSPGSNPGGASKACIGRLYFFVRARVFSACKNPPPCGGVEKWGNINFKQRTLKARNIFRNRN